MIVYSPAFVGSTVLYVTVGSPTPSFATTVAPLTSPSYVCSLFVTVNISAVTLALAITILPTSNASSPL